MSLSLLPKELTRILAERDVEIAGARATARELESEAETLRRCSLIRDAERATELTQHQAVVSGLRNQACRAKEQLGLAYDAVTSLEARLARQRDVRAANLQAFLTRHQEEFAQLNQSAKEAFSDNSLELRCELQVAIETRDLLCEHISAASQQETQLALQIECMNINSELNQPSSIETPEGSPREGSLLSELEQDKQDFNSLVQELQREAESEAMEVELLKRQVTEARNIADRSAAASEHAKAKLLACRQLVSDLLRQKQTVAQRIESFNLDFMRSQPWDAAICPEDTAEGCQGTIASEIQIVPVEVAIGGGEAQPTEDDHGPCSSLGLVPRRLVFSPSAGSDAAVEGAIQPVVNGNSVVDVPPFPEVNNTTKSGEGPSSLQPKAHPVSSERTPMDLLAAWHDNMPNQPIADFENATVEDPTETTLPPSECIDPPEGDRVGNSYPEMVHGTAPECPPYEASIPAEDAQQPEGSVVETVSVLEKESASVLPSDSALPQQEQNKATSNSGTGVKLQMGSRPQMNGLTEERRLHLLARLADAKRMFGSEADS